MLLPYTRRELPGWGRLYARFVGSGRNAEWQGMGPVWLRSKLHGYEMRLMLDRWSNRLSFFLGRFYDLPTQLFLRDRLRPGDTMIDIGANEGAMSLMAAHLVGPSGKVVAFEPNPGPRAILMENLTRNGIGHVDVRGAGLADEAATLKLFVPHANWGEGSFGATNYAADQGDYVDCPVLVGDEALAGETPALLKIDVEGFEHRVILGLERTLERARPAIVMEMVDSHLRRSGTSAVALAGHLRGLGYRGHRLSTRRDGGHQALVLTPLADGAEWVDGDVAWLPGETTARG